MEPMFYSLQQSNGVSMQMMSGIQPLPPMQSAGNFAICSINYDKNNMVTCI
jgi:hypothetical protein